MIASASVFMFLFAIIATCLAEPFTFGSFRDRTHALSTSILPRRRSETPEADYRLAPSTFGQKDSEASDDVQLLDIVLVASVDGKFHALNRTSGRALWSMSSAVASSVPSGFAPLVRTVHATVDPETLDEDAPHQEVYIVEPQTGNIFVMPTPNSPLQRLPFSMSQLVDMSPFSAGDDDRRVFVGRKETSLLLVELETGKVKATVNTECPWDPFEDLSHKDVDVDNSDGSSRPLPPSEVFIGRTDYYITIQHNPPLSSSSSRSPVQNLSFSTYGPNNQDNARQAAYHRTADDAYIQSLPNGEVISFKARGVDSSEAMTGHSSQLLWGHTFNSPIVAVFDVFKSADRQQPFVLLQPRARLQDVMPDIDFEGAAKSNSLPNLDSAYVGLVEETGSLFAMSPNQYPLVVFGDANTHGPQTMIEPPPGAVPTAKPGLPHHKGQQSNDLHWKCQASSKDRRCLTGVRRLEESSRSRLLDGVPSVALPPGHNSNSPNGNSGQSSYLSHPTLDNSSIVPLWIWRPSIGSPTDPNVMEVTTAMLSTAASFLVALILGMVWIFRKSAKSSLGHVPHAVFDEGGHAHSTETKTLATTSVSTATSTTALDAPQSPLPFTDANLAPDGHPVTSADDLVDAEETDKEIDAPALSKRKGPRRKRGKKKKVNFAGPQLEETEGEPSNGIVVPPGDPHVVDMESPQTLPVLAPTVPCSALVVSDTILGFGSHGTVVYRGSLQGRAVAVKRLLQDFVTLASREVSILQESDDHPNVIRYYYQEAHANFLYIALELCPASLAEVIENPDQHRDISIAFDPMRALQEITSGLRHLHALKIIHRDIKPQNILVSGAKHSAGRHPAHRMLISDFGLCKKLDVDQTSFLPTSHGAVATGTVGWRAPEILRGEVQLDETLADDQSQSSRDSFASCTGPSSNPSSKPTRLTKFVDIFSLGCLFYYTLTNGCHPFGDRFERESNILKGLKNLDGLERFWEEGAEGSDLISRMLDPEACKRPDTTTCLLHPFFWNSARRLNFLQDASDRFEIMCREPRDPNLILLEDNASSIMGHDWHTRLDKVFVENLGKFRKYDGRSVQDLLRALRNKKHHYQDLPDNVKRHLGSMPEGFLAYFTRRFPRLFLHVHAVVASTSLRTESMFRSYFELAD